MGWHISCLSNNLKVSKKCAKELFNVPNQNNWEDQEEVVDEDGLLTFNSDHMEHMDYLFDEDIQNVLKKNKCFGKVTFGSLDGDNFGEFWGYEFDGKGNMNLLEGSVKWKSKKE